MNKLPAQPNQSLIDGLLVLNALSVREEPVSCKTLSEELGLEMTRVNRILKTLLYLGMTHQNSSRLYSSGSGLHVLAAQSMYRSGFIQKVLKVITPLQKMNCVVAFGVLWQDSVSYIYHWSPGFSVAEALGRVSLYPASRSSIGMILLSKKSDEEIRKLYAGKKNDGFASISDFMKEIKKTRERGFGQVVDSARSLAVPVGDPAFAGLALSGKIDLKDVSKNINLLLDSANQIQSSKERRIV